MTVALCGLLVATKSVYAGEPKVEYVSSLQTIEARIVSARESREGLILYLQLTNRSGAEEHAFYRINWLDGSGNEVPLGEAWRSISIPAYEARPVQITAPTTSAKDYKIQLSVGKEFQFSSKTVPTAQ
jgi:uncharacterized protein YcfL